MCLCLAGCVAEATQSQPPDYRAGHVGGGRADPRGVRAQGRAVEPHHRPGQRRGPG